MHRLDAVTPSSEIHFRHKEFCSVRLSGFCHYKNFFTAFYIFFDHVDDDNDDDGDDDDDDDDDDLYIIGAVCGSVGHKSDYF